MQEYVARSTGQLLEIATSLESREQRVWYRGHYRSNWLLLPGAFRRDIHRDEPHYERLVSQIFLLRAAARREKCPPREHYAAWLFIMQHYRLPTRLLDWSESPLVGAFFALWNDTDPRVTVNDAAVIWALAPKELNRMQLGRGVLYFVEDREVRGLVPPWLLPGWEIDAAEGTEGARVVAVMPEQVDPRLVTQQGVFTLHAPGVDLATVAEADRFLARIVIPSDCREAIRKDLLRIGVRPMNLFPDLEHLSADLKNFEHVI